MDFLLISRYCIPSFMLLINCMLLHVPWDRCIVLILMALVIEIPCRYLFAFFVNYFDFKITLYLLDVVLSAFFNLFFLCL